MAKTARLHGSAEDMRDPWRNIYLLGAVVALLGVAGMLFDIVLTMMPGWGTSTVPATATAWFQQFSSTPLLALRNLDLLNATISVLTVPFYVALYAAQSRSTPGLALLGLIFATAGTVLFAAGNAALPMLELNRHYPGATPEQRIALAGAAEALLARGAHGSYGALPGFFLSEVGTLLLAVAMLRGGVFSRATGVVGIVGATGLMVYSVAFTFLPDAGALVMAVAVPSGLLMMAWNVMAARRLWVLGRGAR